MTFTIVSRPAYVNNFIGCCRQSALRTHSAMLSRQPPRTGRSHSRHISYPPKLATEPGTVPTDPVGHASKARSAGLVSLGVCGWVWTKA